MSQFGPPALEIFVATVPGLESILQQELLELVPESPGTVRAGGVELSGTVATVQRLNLWSRVASRVLVRVGRVRARHFSALVKAVKRLETSPFLAAGATVEYSVTCRRCRLYHSDAVRERVAEGLGCPVGDAGTGALVLVRGQDDEFTVSVDSSGDLLHMRGARQETGRAPLRETLAAALLRFAGYDGLTPLVDPMCGAGTLLLEGLALARHQAPGAHRRFAFEAWPMHDSDAWQQMLAEAARQPTGASPPVLFGFDRAASQVGTARRNLDRADGGGAVAVEQADIRDLELPAELRSPLVVCNPPYGKRLARRSALGPVYRSLGALVSRHPGASLAFVTSQPGLARATGLRLTEGPVFPTGGLRIRAYLHRP